MIHFPRVEHDGECIAFGAIQDIPIAQLDVHNRTVLNSDNIDGLSQLPDERVSFSIFVRR